MAWDRGLDLVEVNPVADPPVCKMMDFGKLRYEQSKKRVTAKGGELKEIGISLKISPHDLEVKVRQGKKFLEKGNKVKFNLPLRGREKTFEKSLATNLLKKVAELMLDVGTVEQMSKGMVGNRLFVIISPSRGSKKRESETVRYENETKDPQVNEKEG